MNLLAMIWSAAIQAGLASLLLAPPYSGSGAFEDFGLPRHACSFADRAPTVFLHVPALEGASEIVSTPTGKGASR